MEQDFDIHNQASDGDRDYERALRPGRFEAFSGQEKVVENLRIFVQAARMRGEPLDHLLLHGPPGLGKTTLSTIIANELGVGIKITSGPVLDKPGDLAGILTSLVRMMCSSSMKSTASATPWRSISTPPWRIIALIL